MGVSSPRSQMIGVGRLSAPETGRSEVEAVPLLLRGIDHASFQSLSTSWTLYRQ